MSWVRIEVDGFDRLKTALLKAAGRFDEAQEETARELGKEARGLFESTTGRDVSFFEDYSYDGESAVVIVGTNDEKYILLNEGAAAHYIYPVRARFLAYPVFFIPKTAPGELGYNAAGGKFGPTIFRSVVWHPGFKAREFDVAVQEQMDGQKATTTAVDKIRRFFSMFGIHIT